MAAWSIPLACFILEICQLAHRHLLFLSYSDNTSQTLCIPITWVTRQNSCIVAYLILESAMDCIRWLGILRQKSILPPYFTRSRTPLAFVFSYN